MSDIATPGDNASVILTMAQKVHDETIAKANADAEKIHSDAVEESQRLLSEANEIRNKASEEADKKAAEAIEGAQEAAKNILEDSEKKAKEYEDKIQNLAIFEKEYREQMVKIVSAAAEHLELSVTEKDVENSEDVANLEEDPSASDNKKG